MIRPLAIIAGLGLLALGFVSGQETLLALGFGVLFVGGVRSVTENIARAAVGQDGGGR